MACRYHQIKYYKYVIVLYVTCEITHFFYFFFFLEGNHIFHKVYAINGAGLQSDTIVSDGVIVDVSPPIAEGQIQFGPNIIINPSFESDSVVLTITDWTDLLSIGDKCAADFSPSAWNIEPDSCSVVVRPLASIAHNGQAFLLLYGSIQQTLSGLSIGQQYRILFYASHYTVSHYPTMNHEAMLQIGNEKHVLLLFPRPSRSDDDQTQGHLISWQKHVFYFMAKTTSIILKLGTTSNRNGIIIDDVNVQEVSSAASPDNHVRAQSVQIQDWSSVHAVWSFVDAESPVVDYQWAIGR